MIQICNSLLIEFLTEELPPINLYKNIGEVFANTISLELKNFMTSSSQYQIICSPRRFGVLISDIHNKELDNEILRKGPAIKGAITDGVIASSLSGFMKSIGIDNVADLIELDGYFYAKKIVTGRVLNDILATVIQKGLKAIIVGKNMRWADNDYYFVRPVKNLMVLFGSDVLNLNNELIFGLTANNYSYGHRLLANHKIVITNANDYFNIMEQNGYVITDFVKRRDIIWHDLLHVSKKIGLELKDNFELLDEVTAIIEYPTVLQGKFDISYLQVPSECLILSMAKNQKYFALFDDKNQLSNQFLFVANTKTEDYSQIINGNERVLSARLSDAKFFYDVDKKTPLEHFVTKLDKVIYHNKLGTQLDRVERIQKIASYIGQQLALDNDTVAKTAYLIKADLMTEMVAEFPELQGVMGKYYAIYHGIDYDVANAIAMHYYPRFSGDDIPNSLLGIAMSLADKLEVLVGIWGIGLIPTGDKDQYGLRRMALAIIRILLQYKLNLVDLLEFTANVFTVYRFDANIIQEVYQFIITRTYHYFISDISHNYKHHIIQSVIVTNPQYLDYLPNLMNSVVLFSANKDNQVLFSANKRIENILKKIDYKLTDILIDPSLFQHSVEIELNSALNNQHTLLESYAIEYNWSGYFHLLATFNTLITNFFDNVMIMDENFSIRNNRINLLIKLYSIMNKYCKLSELEL